MTARKGAAPAPDSRRIRSEHLKDEVYRQMFRLEERRPGAEMALALALLRARIASDSVPQRGKEKQWLQKICPLCLAMIEAALQPAEMRIPLSRGDERYNGHVPESRKVCDPS
jgi:hypothetical protein